MIFGTVINPELEDEIIVTVIATGFNDKPIKRATDNEMRDSFGSAPQRERSPEREDAPTRERDFGAEQDVDEDDGDVPTFLRNRNRRRR